MNYRISYISSVIVFNSTLAIVYTNHQLRNKQSVISEEEGKKPGVPRVFPGEDVKTIHFIASYSKDLLNALPKLSKVHFFYNLLDILLIVGNS